MDTIADSNCDDCALPVDTGECKCDVPDWFSVDIAINIKLKSTARNATNDALEILSCEHTKTDDYEFSINDIHTHLCKASLDELLKDPNYVP